MDWKNNITWAVPRRDEIVNSRLKVLLSPYKWPFLIELGPGPPATHVKAEEEAETLDGVFLPDEVGADQLGPRRIVSEVVVGAQVDEVGQRIFEMIRLRSLVSVGDAWRICPRPDELLLEVGGSGAPEAKVGFEVTSYVPVWR